MATAAIGLGDGADVVIADGAQANENLAVLADAPRHAESPGFLGQGIAGFARELRRAVGREPVEEGCPRLKHRRNWAFCDIAQLLVEQLIHSLAADADRRPLRLGVFEEIEAKWLAAETCREIACLG